MHFKNICGAFFLSLFKIDIMKVKMLKDVYSSGGWRNENEVYDVDSKTARHYISKKIAIEYKEEKVAKETKEVKTSKRTTKAKK